MAKKSSIKKKFNPITLIVMVVLGAGLVLGINLVKNNQENRSKAASSAPSVVSRNLGVSKTISATDIRLRKVCTTACRTYVIPSAVLPGITVEKAIGFCNNMCNKIDIKCKQKDGLVKTGCTAACVGLWPIYSKPIALGVCPVLCSKVDANCPAFANGKCGTTSRKCASGDFDDKPKDIVKGGKTTAIVWSCFGVSGGTGVECTYKIPVTPKANGSCSTVVNKCKAGTLNLNPDDTATDILWTCKGTGGGNSANCKIAKPPIKPLPPATGADAGCINLGGSCMNFGSVMKSGATCVLRQRAGVVKSGLCKSNPAASYQCCAPKIVFNSNEGCAAAGGTCVNILKAGSCSGGRILNSLCTANQDPNYKCCKK